MSVLEALFWVLLGLLGSFYLFYFSFMMYSAKKPCTHRKHKMLPKVSLVVAAHNEEDVIEQRLDSIEQLDYPKDKLEAIIVDDGSTDNTGEMVAEYTERNSDALDLQLITLPNWSGKPSALNRAWQSCKGEIVVISDADTPLEKNSIRNIVRNFADPAVGAASGRQVVANFNSSSATRLEESYRGIFEILRVGESNMDSTPIFNGPISAFRRDLLGEIEPDSQADDIELCVRIREKGYRAVYDPEAVAYVQVPKGLKNSIRQKSRRARGVIQSFIRHKGMLFNPSYGKYGFLIFPCEFFMHVISQVLVALAVVLAIVNMVFNPSMLVAFLAVCGIVVVVSGLVLLISRRRINLIDILATFLSHEIFLILGLVPVLMKKKDYKWKKARGSQSRRHNLEVLLREN